MSTPSTSLTQRLVHTPIRDLIRGRITGRLDLDTKLAQANLTPDATALVKQTVRRTKLFTASKKSRSPTNLSPTSATPPTPCPRFLTPSPTLATPPAAATLIRRAKKRQRPFFRTRQAAKLAVAATVVLYVAVAARVFWGAPEIKIDYLARIKRDRPHRAAKRKSLADLPRRLDRRVDFAELDLNPLYHNAAMDEPFTHPADPQWAATLSFLAEQGNLLDALRRGGALPHLGFRGRLRR